MSLNPYESPRTAAEPAGQGDVFAFVSLFMVNLLASYAPALLWVTTLPGEGGDAWAILFSPFSLILLIIWPTDLVIPVVLLIGFLFLVAVFSWAFRYSEKGWVIIPTCLFVACLAQGLYSARAIAGINAIGGS